MNCYKDYDVQFKHDKLFDKAQVVYGIIGSNVSHCLDIDEAIAVYRFIQSALDDSVFMLEEAIKNGDYTE